MSTLPVRAAALFAVLLLVGQQVHAEDVVMIEEHWQLDVGGPDTSRSAPQVSMVMSATGDLNDDFFVLTINHWSHPDFSPGGLQLQRWRGEDCVASDNGGQSALLNTDGEAITWVQRLSLDGSVLKFEVVDGQSVTWGGFGNTGLLQMNVSTELTRLNNYLPAVSLTESGIGYAGNRVSSLTLQKLRWQTADGQVHELQAPIDIATGLDP